MKSESRDTIIVRVKPAIKRDARRMAKESGLTLTQYIALLIQQEVADRAEQAKEAINAVRISQ